MTNKTNMPDPLFNAIEKARYPAHDKDTFSVTEILNPVKIVVLNRRYGKDVIEDASEGVYRLLGSAVHSILEAANSHDLEYLISQKTQEYLNQIRIGKNTNPTKQEMIEHIFDSISLDDLLSTVKDDRFVPELRWKIPLVNGTQISGQVDLYDKKLKEIHDWKVTTIWSYIYKNRKGSKLESWTQQVNIYKYLMEKAGYPVESLRLSMIFRDWEKSKAKYDHEYPYPSETIDIEYYDNDFVESLIYDKINQIRYWLDKPDDEIPVCTEEERWQDKTMWAVRKKTNKKSSKNLYAWSAAKKWLDDEATKTAAKSTKDPNQFEKQKELIMKQYVIEERPGMPKRCMDYCQFNDKCNFYQDYLKNNK